MSSLIESLWTGNICMCDGCGIHDPHIKELLAFMERNRDTLNAQLTPDQRTLFEKYMDHAEDYLLCMTQHAFRDGFSLAVGLLTQALGTVQ